MANKIKDKKTKRPKNKEKKLSELTFVEKIALLSGCSPRYVQKVLISDEPGNTALWQNILINAERVKEHDNKLLTAVKNVVPFNDSKMFIEH